MPISDRTRDEAAQLVARYPVARSALLPLLHLLQSDEGHVSADGIAFCADALGLTRAEVGAVATFYTMFKREPFGSYLVSVCTNPTCKLAGGQAIHDAYVEACGGHVDDEAGVMVEHAECLGICDAAPVVQVNYEMFGRMDHDEAMDLLARVRGGDPPTSPLSGTTPPTFAAVQRELSGIEDAFGDRLVEAARLQVTTSDVPPAYRTGETDIPVTHPGGDPAGHGGQAFRLTSGIGGRTDRPDDRPEPEPGTETEVVEQLAGQGSGTPEDLASQLVAEQPVEPAPRAEERPPLPLEDGETPASMEAPDDADTSEGSDDERED